MSKKEFYQAANENRLKFIYPKNSSLELIEEQLRTEKFYADFRKKNIELFSDLEVEGLNIKTIDELSLDQEQYLIALPVLLNYLTGNIDYTAKLAIVNVLHNKWAKNKVVIPLINLYKETSIEQQDLKWMIADTLERYGNKRILDNIKELIKDKRNGSSRWLLILAVGKYGNKDDIEFLRPYLKNERDEGIIAHTILALGKLKAVELKDEIEQFSEHESVAIKAAVKKTVKKFEKIK